MLGKLYTILSITLVVCISTASAGQMDDVEIKTTPLTENIFMVTGKGGNIGLFVGRDGSFLIDDQFAPLTDKILAAIKAAGGQQPKFLINTHYHGDHTGDIFSTDFIRSSMWAMVGRSKA